MVAPFVIYKGTVGEYIIIGVYPGFGKWACKTFVEKFEIIIVDIISSCKDPLQIR